MRRSSSKPKYPSAFPSDFQDPSFKATKEYCLPCAKHIAEAYMAGNDIIGETRRKEIEENRNFSEGNQDAGRYKQFKAVGKSETGDLVSAVDLDFSPIGMLRTVVRSAMRSLKEVRHTMRVDAVDPLSMREKDVHMAVLRAKMNYKNKAKQRLGIDIVGNQFVPNDEQELDVYAKMGFKNGYEVCAETYLQVVDNDNKYLHRVDKHLNWELVNSDMGAVHLYYDENGFIREEPIDITELVILGGGRERDYSDAKGFGIVSTASLETLRLMAGDQVSETEWEKIAQNLYNTTTERTYPMEYYKNEFGQWNWQRFTLTYVTAYWQTIDTFVKDVKKDDTGAMTARNRSYLKAKKKAEGRTVTDVHMWYRATYLIDCKPEICFNYGPLPNMVREKYKGKKKGKALCPIKVVRVSPNKNNKFISLVSSIKKFEDVAEKTWLQMQNELARAAPDMYVYNVSSILNSLGEAVEADRIDEVVLVAEQAGRLFVQYNDNYDVTTGHKPVEKVDGGLSKAFNDFVNVLNLMRDLMHSNAGIPSIMTGQEQHPDIGKAVTESMLSGSDRVLDDIAEAKAYLQKLSAEHKMNMVLRLTDEKTEIKDPYADMISGPKRAIVKLASGMSMRELSVRLEAAMTEQQVQILLNDLKEMTSKYTQTAGAEGLSEVEYMWLYEMMRDNPKLARYFVASRIDARIRRNQEMKMQDSQMNAQAQQMSNAQAHEMKMAELSEQREMKMLESQLKVTEIRESEKEKRHTALLLERLKGENKRAEERIKAQAQRNRQETATT